MATTYYARSGSRRARDGFFAVWSLVTHDVSDPLMMVLRPRDRTFSTSPGVGGIERSISPRPRGARAIKDDRGAEKAAKVTL